MKKVVDYFLPRIAADAKRDGVDRFVVAAVISKASGDKILSLKRASDDFMGGLYELPSGKVELNENLIDALVREVKEETNLNAVEVTDYLSYFDYRSQSGRLTRQLNFVVSCNNLLDVRLNDKEHEGYTWVGRQELSKYNISSETKKVIETFFVRRTLDTTPSEAIIEGFQSGIQQFVVGGVISHKGKALLMKRASDDFMGGIYELPSGKLEAGESVEMGIMREVKEETNLTVSSLGKQLAYFDYTSGSGKRTRQLNYDINVQDAKEVKLSDEHEGFAWVSANELQNYPVSQEVKAIVSSYLTEKKRITDAEQTLNQGFFAHKREREEVNKGQEEQLAELTSTMKKPHVSGE